jgi:hypothetical protein
MRRAIASLTCLGIITSCTSTLSEPTTSVQTAGSTTQLSLESTSTTTTEVIEGGWLRVPHNEGAFGRAQDQVVVAIAAGPSGFVAVGVDERRGNLEGAVVWMSLDGQDWSRIRQDPSLVDAEMRDVVWHPAIDRFVAVGNQSSEGTVWWSPDGTSWERVALLPFAQPGGGIDIQSVIDAGPGLLAVGREWLGEGSSVPAVWTSADGRSWVQGDVDISDLDTEHKNGIVDVAGDQGSFLAVGFTATSASDRAPALWISTDATTWQQVEIGDEDAALSQLNAIEAEDGMIVMVGESRDEGVDARAWTSEDAGDTWARIEVETGLVGIPALMDVTPIPNGWIAVGFDGTTLRPETVAAVWFIRSDDGSVWTRYNARHQSLRPGIPTVAVVMTSVASSNGAVVAAGYEGRDCVERFSGCDLDAAFWMWEIGS